MTRKAQRPKQTPPAEPATVPCTVYERGGAQPRRLGPGEFDPNGPMPDKVYAIKGQAEPKKKRTRSARPFMVRVRGGKHKAGPGIMLEDAVANLQAAIKNLTRTER